MQRIQLSEKLRRFSIFIFYFLFLTTPLIWVEANSELFEVPKMVFVYFVSATLFCLWLARKIVDPNLGLKKNIYFYALAAFVGSQILSTIQSVHPYTSVFGYYSRLHGGLLSTFAYTALAVSFIHTFRPKEAVRAFGVLISSGIIVSLIAFPEHFGFAFSCLIITGNIQATCWVQDIVTRVFGTFGQPNWLAAYIVTILPLLWASLFRVKHLNSVKALLLQFGLFISFSTLLFTRSRSGLLGLAVAFGVFLLVTIIHTIKSQSSSLRVFGSWKTLLIIGALMLVPLALFGSEFTPSASHFISKLSSSQNLPAKATPPVPDSTIPLIERGGTDSGEIRQIVWRGAWHMFLDNWLFGTGVESFAYSYYNYRPVEHNLVSEWDFLYNKAHNEFLNFAATTGVIGLGSYLAIIISFIVISLQGFLKKYSKNSDGTIRWLHLGLLSGYLALAVSNFFGFSTVSVAVLFFIYPALSLVLQEKEPKEKSTKDYPLTTVFYIGLIGVIAAFGSLIFFLGKYYAADLYFAAGQKADTKNDLTTAIEDYQTAITLSPNQARFYNSYADALSKAAYAFALDGNADATERFAKQASLASAETLRLNPVHINYYKHQAGVFIRMAPFNPELLSIAEKILDTGLKLAPTDAKIAYNMGLIQVDEEATSAAQIDFEHAVNLKQNYEAARMELAKIYEQNQEFDKALEQYQYILTYIAPDNSIAKEAVERLQDETSN